MGLRFLYVAVRGWVVENGGRPAGCAHPLEKSAPSITDTSIHRLDMRTLIDFSCCQERSRWISPELLYLPPYSPDFNPIEEVFSKDKGLTRKAGARTHEALIGAMGKALEAVTAQDARGYFDHCGYRSMGQLL
jgi:hypothetical protein